MSHLKMIKRIVANEAKFNAKFKKMVRDTNKILVNVERKKNKLIRDFRNTYEYKYQKNHCIECGSTEDLQDIEFSPSKLCVVCNIPIEIDEVQDRIIENTGDEDEQDSK